MNKYNFLMRAIHLIMALVIISLLTVGIIMTDMENTDEKWQIYFMHKSFGVLALILIIARIFIRSYSQIPEMPKELGQANIKAAKIGHFSLYFFMIIIPITGVIMSIFSGKGLPFFAHTFFENFDTNKLLASTAHQIHISLPYIFIIIILLHILGTIKHLLIDKINLLRRIFW